MKIRNRLIALFLVVVMISSVAPIANAYYSNDVTRDIGDPLFDAINYMADNRFMSGSGNRFQPNETVSRAMVATVLYYFSRETGTYSSSFTDVSSSAWYYNPVSWAAQKGIMYGTSNTVFNPNGMITREQLMATLYRYAGYRGKARDTTDRVSRCGDYSSISSYAIPAMNWAVNTGILHLGLPTACICPRSLVSRKWLAFYMSKLSSKVLGMEKADRYAFSNAERYMKTVGNGYYVSGVDQSIIYNYINTLYSGIEAQNLRNEIALRLTDPWIGSCFGFSVTAILDKTGIIAVNENRGGECGTTLNNYITTRDKDGKLIVPNSTVSAINFYQISQYLPDFSVGLVPESAMPGTLECFVKALKENGIVLFCYSRAVGENIVSHAVVAYGYGYNNGVHTARVYDNRDTKHSIPNDSIDGILEIASDYSSIRYITTFKDANGNRSVEVPVALGYCVDIGRYRDLDIDGIYNGGKKSTASTGASDNGKMQSELASSPFANDTSIIILDANSTVQIVNAEGETLEFSKTEYSGSMQVKKMVMMCTEPMQCALYIPDSEKITVTQLSGTCDIHFLGSGAFAAVRGSGIEEIAFYADNRVSLRGDDMDCDVAGTVRSTDFALARLHGRCADYADFSFCAEEIGIMSTNTQWEVALADKDTYEWASEVLTDVPEVAEIDLAESTGRSGLCVVQKEKKGIE